MKILFVTSGSGKILNKILKKIDLSNNIFLFGDFKKSCNEIAKKKKITIIGKFKKIFDTEIFLFICKKYKIDYILLYSFIHKIDTKVLKFYSGRIFNSHHSILPAFRGKYFINEPRNKYLAKKIFERCLYFGSNITGNTIHVVDEHLDNGQPVLQSILAFDNISNPKIVRHELFKQECESVKQFIIWLLQNRLVKKKTNIIEKKKYFIKDAKYVFNIKNPYIPNLDYKS
jgi:phosphoribosylglycinamide formyltransferase-1